MNFESQYPKPSLQSQNGPASGSQPEQPAETSAAPLTADHRLSITFWEDEDILCYQFEAKGVIVSRREDTNFINGTKLLNVTHMTRGRRDGILKSERVRHVVKVGSMDLKGVWIPFERARDLAQAESIYEDLKVLFQSDIKNYYQSHCTNMQPYARAKSHRKRQAKPDMRPISQPLPMQSATVPQNMVAEPYSAYQIPYGSRRPMQYPQYYGAQNQGSYAAYIPQGSHSATNSPLPQSHTIPMPSSQGAMAPQYQSDPMNIRSQRDPASYFPYSKFNQFNPRSYQ